jgi:ATP-GRASP peptide maturase of grasp-with-spasm system
MPVIFLKITGFYIKNYNMIYIYSQSEAEISTEDVIDWLNYFNAPYIRLNGNDVISDYSEVIQSVDNNYYGTKKISTTDAVWFRRWINTGTVNNKFKNQILSNRNFYEISRHLSGEINVYSKLFWKKFKDCKWLTYPYELEFSKIDVLYKALECNLNIPETLITSSKLELIKFMESSKKIITKVVTNGPPSLDLEKSLIAFQTAEITKKDIESMTDSFFPSFFQKLIEKQYELRIFFVGKKLYPMAIFSQNDEQTKIDFRNYNHSKPNRKIPYKLPLNLEKKILKLINTMNLTTGSVDIIKSINNEYIFLEINPVGQFGMTSHPCNYFIEKEIAETLIKMNTK